MFLAAIVSSFYYARRRKWLVAGLAGAIATLTRPTGFLIFAALALEYLYQRNFRLREIRADVGALCLVPLALTLYFGYLHRKFGSFFLFLQSQHAWGRSMVGTGGWLESFARPEAGDLFVVILTMVSIAVAWHRLRPSYVLYATLAFLTPLASGATLSMARFCSVIFPIYIVLAMAGRNPEFDRCWLITSTALSVFFMALFSQWHYAG
jgi:hypothetical protein